MSRWDEQAFEKIYQDEKFGSLYYVAANNWSLSLIDFQLVRDFSLKNVDVQEEHIVLFLLVFHSLNEGSLCLKLGSEHYYSSLNIFPQIDSVKMKEQIEHGAFESLVAIDARMRPLVLKDDNLYLYRNLALEQKLIENCQKLWQENSQRQLTESLIADFKTVFESLSYELHPRQTLGVICGVLNQFSIITGGPGTGKTSVLATLLRILVRQPGEDIDKIRLVAPTGKAAQRMADSLEQSISGLSNPEGIDLHLADLEATTIHRLIKSYLNKENVKINAQTLVIDEVSMVDARLMADLLNAISSECRVIFLGDKHQLPSVEAGQVLTDLLPTEAPLYSEAFLSSVKQLVRPEIYESMVIQSSAQESALQDKVVLLTKSYRSAEEILELSLRVNVDSEDELTSYTLRSDLLLQEESEVTEGLPLFDFKKGVNPYPQTWFDGRSSVQFFWESFPEEDFFETWFEQCFNQKTDSYLALLRKTINQQPYDCLDKLFSELEDSRILCFTRTGEHGVNRLNQIGSKYLRNTLSDYNHADLFHGAPIMITRNDYSRGLYNGDVGLVLKVDDGYKAYFRKEDGYVSFSVEVLLNYELSFAITVHKSQGSEYNKVLLLVPESRENRLLSREILYTGITRAKNNCIIAGDKTIFLEGAARKIHRESSGALWK
ncbi:MAG: exodeoxyribonuclease V subunit alpha [Lentisphaerales bacterium]|nr:exodeoxyribonuclease V subunit alpha [Lentisphaerales bacterium]